MQDSLNESIPTPKPTPEETTPTPTPEKSLPIKTPQTPEEIKQRKDNVQKIIDKLRNS